MLDLLAAAPLTPPDSLPVVPTLIVGGILWIAYAVVAVRTR